MAGLGAVGAEKAQGTTNTSYSINAYKDPMSFLGKLIKANGNIWNAAAAAQGGAHLT